MTTACLKAFALAAGTALLCSLSSCVKEKGEEAVPAVQEDGMTIRAGINPVEPETKTALTDNTKVHWVQGDVIRIFN